MEKMKAVIYKKYGPPEVLHEATLPIPQPKKSEVQIRVRATTITAGDYRMRQGRPFTAKIYNGLLGPRRVQVLGFELAGEVSALGDEVTRFKIGDRVFAYCGFGFGAYAQYRCLPDIGNHKIGIVAHMPKKASFEEAAALPLGAMAPLKQLEAVNLRKGDRILINGASGSVGSYALQLAQLRGAEITAVCSQKNFGMVSKLGATNTIDYHDEDFTQGDARYDVIYDAVGKLISGISKSQAQAALADGGRYISVEDGYKPELADLDQLAEMVDAGQIKPFIDRKFGFAEIPEAHQYVESGSKRGNVTVTVD